MPIYGWRDLDSADSGRLTAVGTAVARQHYLLAGAYYILLVPPNIRPKEPSVIIN
jgi:hypothetical protein